MADRINFKNKINDSVQVGDELYYMQASWDTPAKAGDITEVGQKYVKVATPNTLPSELGYDGDGNPTTFFMFKKINTSSTNADDIVVNSYAKSGAKGSYASVKMYTPTAGSKTKLFALGAEIAESSK